MIAAALAITALFALGLAAFGFWNRPRHRLDGWWHQQQPQSHVHWTEPAWRRACEQSLAGSRRRRGSEE